MVRAASSLLYLSQPDHVATTGEKIARKCPPMFFVSPSVGTRLYCPSPTAGQSGKGGPSSGSAALCDYSTVFSVTLPEPEVWKGSLGHNPA